MSFAVALHSGEICGDDLIVKPEVMLVAWHVLLCSKWSFWCSVKICISASLPRQMVCTDCSIMAGAAVIFTSHLPFLAHNVDSKKIAKGTESRARQYHRPCYSGNLTQH